MPPTFDGQLENKLAQVQRFMQDVLLASDLGPHATEVDQYIAATPNLNAAQHLAIYQRAYLSRLLQCMQGQFKALNHALGPELFRDFASEYLREIPSSSPTLAKLGDGFTAWLKRNRPDAAQAEKEVWIDFMIELADFEWTLYTLFDAPGAEERGYATLQDAGNPSLRLQPCIRLRRYRFPVSAYYQQVADEADPDFPLPSESDVALVRSHYRIGIFNLLPAQYVLLDRLAQLRPEQTLDDALAEAIKIIGPETQPPMQAWLRTWITAGLMVIA
ncbi:HvfC/BufC family peptide modification chaperone [Andreprevotia chitinilytica]|uniref:HvfC/BufC family peptide modification chaperone n=1 Tax=Andreprevotia chitinilytica TaxID=396808 RepID=UPI000690A4DD|nr:putative DNA-binding domain-containing protein [Andreprevotia chitinilytica]